METVISSPSYTPTSLTKVHCTNPRFFSFHSNGLQASTFSNSHRNASRCKLFTTISSSPSAVSKESIDPPEPEVESDVQGDKFDWYSEWYPVMPVCDLDKRVPHGKKVMGMDVVVWWNSNENAWKVFDDSCPHRLAPLSEGRIDQWGRLQCVYHGWCFNGSGDCKLIPQAPPDGPPVHTFKKACVAAYPSTVHHDIVWFWPSTDPQYKDVIMNKKPPFIPELDDPSYSRTVGNRDFPYGYEVLIENLMDPAHLPYAHYGMMQTKQPKEKMDREGGRPMDFNIIKLDKNGFIGKQEGEICKFLAPCIFYLSDPTVHNGNGVVSSFKTEKKLPEQRRVLLIFICIPVSPGNSRLIWAFTKNFEVLIEKIVPCWIFHMVTNLILDSDLYLLHVEERKIMDVGLGNWQKACFVPTKSDAFVVGFRRWLNKYAGCQVDWRGKYNGALPLTPPREQLMDRYWSHVVNCSKCNTAYKLLNALKVILPIISLVSIGIVAATKETVISPAARTTLVTMAVACFATSRWLAHYIYKNFHFHDYNHAFH